MGINIYIYIELHESSSQLLIFHSYYLLFANAFLSFVRMFGFSDIAKSLNSMHSVSFRHMIQYVQVSLEFLFMTKRSGSCTAVI